ncbi:MAG: hypothetical protein GY757_58015 [bacterium]|nr:hypothetical protein [bacterium]
MSNYSFRFIKSTWGISIDIGGQCKKKSSSDLTAGLVGIAPGLWATALFKNVFVEDKAFLWQGLRFVSDSILSHSPYDNDTLIVFNSVQYGLCDYQAEGLFAAAVGWAAQEFQFEMPELNICFNKASNRYVFENRTADPGRHESDNENP